MEQLCTNCAGLDVHKQTVVACVLHASDAGRHRKEIRTFATTTAALLALADWLRAAAQLQALGFAVSITPNAPAA